MPGFLNFTKEKLVSKVIEVEIKDIRPNPHQPRILPTTKLLHLRNQFLTTEFCSRFRSGE